MTRAEGRHVWKCVCGHVIITYQQEGPSLQATRLIRQHSRFCKEVGAL